MPDSFNGHRLITQDHGIDLAKQASSPDEAFASVLEMLAAVCCAEMAEAWRDHPDARPQLFQHITRHHARDLVQAADNPAEIAGWFATMEGTHLIRQLRKQEPVDEDGILWQRHEYMPD